MLDSCACDLCEGRLTGAHEDIQDDTWPGYKEIEAAWADYWAVLRKETDAELAAYEAAGIVLESEYGY